MATIFEATIQQTTREVRKWTADFTDDIPTGGSVTAGTAYHTPPSGNASTPTVTFTASTVSAALGPLTVVGIHYVDIQATYSDNQKSEVRVAFTLNYPDTVARSGMGDLITTVRASCDAGPNDYLVAGVPYWSDAQIQTVLDRHRLDVFRHELSPIQTYADGTVVYKDYYARFGNIESGTAVFELETAAGSTVGTATYSMDYARGVATFTADQAGSAYFLTGRRYDLNAAAADMWRVKAANVAKLFNFSTDGHRIDRGELRKNYLDMASYFEAQAEIINVKIVRDDL